MSRHTVLKRDCIPLLRGYGQASEQKRRFHWLLGDDSDSFIIITYNYIAQNSSQTLSLLRRIIITAAGTNRKPVCDFLLVNNTALRPIPHRFPVIVQYQPNYRF